MPDIKFCGLTRTADAVVAGELGAAYAGVVFAGGPREAVPGRAAEVWGALPAGVRRVGVFGADVRTRLGAVRSAAHFDVAQLHADPTPEDVAWVRSVFGGEVWVAVRLVAGESIGAIPRELFAADAILLEPRVPGRLGGTGEALDWHAIGPSLAQRRAGGPRIVLAGGLNAGNVASAIAAVRPDVVDVSSGVESAPGIKDHARMAAFVEAVRRSQQ